MKLADINEQTRDRVQHLKQSEELGRRLCSAKCFTTLDHATTKYQVKIKLALKTIYSEPRYLEHPDKIEN